HDVHGPLRAGSGCQPSRPPVRGVVLHPRRRGRRRRGRRPLHAPAGRRVLDRGGLRARVLRDAGEDRAVAGGVGPGTAQPTLLPPPAGLGLSRREAGVGSARGGRVTHVSDEAATGVLDDLELYKDLYRRMLLIRGFEDLVQSLFLAGEVYGTTHLYSGQEAIATGAASILEERGRAPAPYPGHR